MKLCVTLITMFLALFALSSAGLSDVHLVEQTNSKAKDSGILQNRPGFKDLEGTTRLSVRESQRRSVLATIKFSAYDAAWLYINGKLVQKNSKPSRYSTVTRRVKRGDVIGVLARAKSSTAYGIIVDVFYNGKHYPANKGHWRAHKYHSPIWGSWRKKSFSSCKWMRPILVKTRSIVTAKGFPYKSTGAKYIYVQNKGLGRFQGALLRHVVGGETCGRGAIENNRAIIKFSADDYAWLYLNGKRLATNSSPKKFTTIVSKLKTGDVIAVGARNKGGGRGVIVDVFYKNQHYSTLSRHWKAHKYNTVWGRKWRMKFFSSCTWKYGVRVRRESGVLMATKFPYGSSGARYIWASSKGRTPSSSTVLRHVVGGEKCGKHLKEKLDEGNRKSIEKNMAVIKFASYNRLSIFINGHLVGGDRASRRYTILRVNVKRGDVLGVLAHRGKGEYGVIMDVTYKNRHYSTGSRYWKANNYLPSWKNVWKTRRFSSCYWARAITLKRSSTVSSVASFPYGSTGAKYVWASPGERGNRKSIFLRHVIGGEKCSGVAGNEINKKPRTDGKSPRGKRTCHCRATGRKKGQCYVLRNPTKARGRCTHRPCEVKYECVGRKYKNSKICIKRSSFVKVVPTKSSGFCKKVYKKMAFYVPYD